MARTKEFPFYWVDAFTSQAFSGNPCAVVFNADSLTAEEMQSIARELNLSETAFVLKSFRADFRARYFTPSREIPLAGHPTISTIKALIDAGRIPPEKNSVTLELNVGIIPIEIRRVSEREEQIFMTQLKPQFLKKYSIEDIRAFTNLDVADFASISPQTVSTGTPMLMVMLKDVAAVQKLKIDSEKFTRLDHDFFSIHFFCLGGVQGGQTFARHPALEPGDHEDPFTGSATGCMGAYLWHLGYLHGDSFVAEQGHFINRPGAALVQKIGDPQDLEAIRIGGAAVTLVRGTLSL